MALIDHQQIDGRQVHALGVNGAPVQRLNRCDLHQLKRAPLKSGLNDSVANPGRMQFAAGVGDDLAPMRQHHDGFCRTNKRADDIGADDGFAATRWCDQNDAAFVFARTIKFGDDIDLIRAQFGGSHVAPDRVRGHCSPAPMPLRIVAMTVRHPSSATRPLRWQASISRSMT